MHEPTKANSFCELTGNDQPLPPLQGGREKGEQKYYGFDYDGLRPKLYLSKAEK